MSSAVIHQLGELAQEGLRVAAHLGEWALRIEKLASQVSKDDEAARTDYSKLADNLNKLKAETAKAEIQSGEAQVGLGEPSVGQFTCKDCGRSFKRPQAYALHRNAFRKWGTCDATGRYNTTRREKYQRLNPSLPPGAHECPHCGRDLLRPQGLAVHLRARALNNGICTTAEEAVTARKRKRRKSKEKRDG